MTANLLTYEIVTIDILRGGGDGEEGKRGRGVIRRQGYTQMDTLHFIGMICEMN